jgi:hypothetical protein
MRALAHLAHGEKIPDCTKCEGEPRLRDRYGCDGPAQLPVLSVTCGTCGGSGFAAPGEKCAAGCTMGSLQLYRCPLKLVDDTPGGRAVYAAFGYCVEDTLPSACGPADHPASFLELRRIYRSERAAIATANDPEAKKERRAELIAEIQARRAGGAAGG